MSEINKTTAEIILGGKTITIEKLKAGRFFDAQKEIAGLIQEASSSVSANVNNAPITDIESVKSADLVGLSNLLDAVPRRVAKFVAICAGIEEAELLDMAYPDEITKAFDKCLELNNVMENIKNSVAPMERLGAKIKSEK